MKYSTCDRSKKVKDKKVEDIKNYMSIGLVELLKDCDVFEPSKRRDAAEWNISLSNEQLPKLLKIFSPFGTPINLQIEEHSGDVEFSQLKINIAPLLEINGLEIEGFYVEVL